MFEFKAASELGESLGMQPIRDLTTALSVNDRMLYKSELFGDNIQLMNDTLSSLNTFNNMDEAKGVLMNLAQTHSWLGEERKDTARAFVKLVRRRFI